MTINVSRIRLLSAISNFSPAISVARTVVYRGREITIREKNGRKTITVAGSTDTSFKPKNNSMSRVQAIRDVDSLLDWMDESPLN